MTSHNRAKGSRLGTRIRGALAERYSQRNHQHANLYYGFSMKSKRDFVSPSEQRFAYALYVDIDPYYTEVEHEPPELKGPNGFSLLAATAVTRDNVKEFHFLAGSKDGAPAALLEGQFAPLQAVFAMERHERGRECKLRVLTVDEVFENELLLSNWFEAQAWIVQFRYLSLTDARINVSAALHAHRRRTLGELLDEGGSAYVAAALEGVTTGFFDCDLDREPFCKATIFEAKRRAPPRLGTPEVAVHNG